MGIDLAQARKIPWKSGAFSAAFVRSHGDAGLSPAGPEGLCISVANPAINGHSSTVLRPARLGGADCVHWAKTHRAPLDRAAESGCHHILKRRARSTRAGHA